MLIKFVKMLWLITKSAYVMYEWSPKDPSRDIGPRLLSDTVASITEEPLVSRAFPNRSLQLEAPGFTPWFDAWTKIYLQVVTKCFGFLSFEKNHVTQLT